MGRGNKQMFVGGNWVTSSLQLLIEESQAQVAVVVIFRHFNVIQG